MYASKIKNKNSSNNLFIYSIRWVQVPIVTRIFCVTENIGSALNFYIWIFGGFAPLPPSIIFKGRRVLRYVGEKGGEGKGDSGKFCITGRFLIRQW